MSSTRILPEALLQRALRTGVVPLCLYTTACGSGDDSSASATNGGATDGGATDGGATDGSATEGGATDGGGCAGAPPPPNEDNTITIRNQSGVEQENYPLQFGRPFIQGEIANCPQILVDGTPIDTQANVKNRHDDGSAKYAILSAVLPSLPASGELTVTFQNQCSCNDTPLSTDEMLDPAFDFDAQMSLAFTSGEAGTASARQMLEDGNCKPWAPGPIAQMVECGDDTTARKYDLGNGDGYRPFRPRFYATFWPATHQVTVRYVGENGLTTELEDLKYQLSLSIGNASPQDVYSIDLSTSGVDGKWHASASNWTKVFWLGATPEKMVDIDHNLAYLASTRYFPNYDTSVTIAPAAIEDWYGRWSSRPNDIYDALYNNNGLWNDYMPAVADHPDLGPYPTWTTLWLYSGDWRLRQIALNMADLASAWSVNFRETDPTRRLSRDDPSGSGTGLGRVISITDRRTIYFGLALEGAEAPEDNVTVVGPVAVPNWTFDLAHQPNPFYPQYVLTGDPYYLDEMYMWSGYNVAARRARGIDGSLGGIFDQLRGAGWVLRNRVEAAFAAPDGAPEKHYFTYLTNDALAILEGGFDIMGTVYDGSAAKNWGQSRGDLWTLTNGPYSGEPPVLQNWESNTYDVLEPMNDTGFFQNGKVVSITSPWMQWYVLYALGRATELGFAAGPLLAWSSKYLIDAVLVSGHPKIIGLYWFPVEKMGGGFFTWDEVVTEALDPAYLAEVDQRYEVPAYQGYAVWTKPGAAYAVDNDVPGAKMAWDWLKPNIYEKAVSDYDWEPRWNIHPRTDGNVLPAISPEMPAAADMRLEFSADSRVVSAGQSVTLTWEVTHASSCDAYHGGTYAGPRPVSGMESVKPTAPITSYDLDCRDASGHRLGKTVNVGVTP